MKLFTCCCSWTYVVGRRKVYGPIFPVGTGDFPGALSSAQRMMTRAEWGDQYGDCATCHAGGHHHAPRP